MMRGPDVYATAVRRRDGSVVTEQRNVPHFLQGSRWAKVPFIRGTFVLIETLTLGLRSLQFSANVALQDEAESAAPPDDSKAEAAPRRPWVTAGIVAALGGALVWKVAPKLAPLAAHRLPMLYGPEQSLLAARIVLGAVTVLLVALLLLEKPKARAEQPQTMSDAALWGAMVPALLLGLGLFILLPSFLAGLVKIGGGYGAAMLKNVIEGGIRLALILGYIAAISLMGQVRRVFQYHGAEHKVINALEIEGRVDPDIAMKQSPLHPRCGTAFLLLFIVLKIVVGWFFGWPVWYWRLAVRLLMVPVVAALAYETTRLAGRHRNSLLARVMSGPGLLLQRMTTREPEMDMIRIAIYALTGVAPEVPLPVGWPPARVFTASGPGPAVGGEEAKP